MKITRAIPLILISSVATATVPFPDRAQLLLLDRVLALAQSESAQSAVAVGLLERIADGLWAQITEAEESSVGLKPGQLRNPAFGVVTVRASALLDLGKVGSPEAAAHLAKFTPADFSSDASGYLWAMSQVAIQMAELAQLADVRSQNAFLEAELTKKIEAGSGGEIRSWATEALCERGVSAALPAIRATLEKWGDPNRVSDDLEFCSQRILMVSHGLDLDTLASALSVNLQPHDLRLANWAISKLAGMNAPAADAVLSRFRATINQYPMESEPRRRLGSLATAIELQMQSRSK